MSDRDAFAAARRLTREEGILSGGSCGTALVAALTVARELTETDRGHEAILVMLLPDGGRNYLSKLYNDEWMRVNGLLATSGGAAHIGDLLIEWHRDMGRPTLVLARTSERVGAAIEKLQAYGISQMPVSEAHADAPGADRLDAIVGSISEKGPARSGLPRSVRGRADRRRGDGPRRCRSSR